MIKHKFRIKYRRCGVWLPGITVATRKAGEQLGPKLYPGREILVSPLR